MNAIMNQYRKSPFWATFILIMLKMALFRSFTFEEVQISRLLSDAAAVLVVLCVLELISSARWKTAVMSIGNGIMSLILFACSVYFSFFGSIPSYTALHGLDQVGQVKESVESAISLKFFLLFLDLAVLLILYLVTLRSKADKPRSQPAAKPLYVGIALIVALGVTALQSLSSHKGSLTSVRDETLKTREGQPMRATIHPSMLLRLPSEDDKEAEFARFVADLKKAKKLALAA